MAESNRTTSKRRALTVSKRRALTVAKPATPAEASTPQHVLLAPNVLKRLDGLCIHGCEAVTLAGMLNLCGDRIHREAVAIQKQHPGALVEHTQELTGYIGFLADTLSQMGEAIENKAGEAADVVRLIGGAA
jgi:hypothetical protein